MIEGRGWTVVDGIRHGWEAGDLILLPLKPGGVEHQHFNAEPAKPCVWLGIIHGGLWDALGDQWTRRRNHRLLPAGRHRLEAVFLRRSERVP